MRHSEFERIMQFLLYFLIQSRCSAHGYL